MNTAGSWVSAVDSGQKVRKLEPNADSQGRPGPVTGQLLSAGFRTERPFSAQTEIFTMTTTLYFSTKVFASHLDVGLIT